MSKQRQKDRAAREAAAAAKPSDAGQRARAAATEAAVDAGRRPSATTPKARQSVYRQRRFPPQPVRLKVALALGWLTVLVLTLYLVPTWTGRLGLMVIATFALPLIVVIVRDPSRRTR